MKLFSLMVDLGKETRLERELGKPDVTYRLNVLKKMPLVKTAGGG
jgi:hypothetical protein